MYVKDEEADVEVLDQVSVSFVRLLHERHQRVFSPSGVWFSIDLDPILGIGPETIWKNTG